MSDFYEPDEDLAELLSAFESAKKRITEPLRRELANRNRDAVEVGSARPVHRKRLDSIHSVRFSPDEAEQLGKAAERMGLSGGRSELLRAAARRMIQPVGFRCGHVAVSCGAGFTSFSCWQGCDMEPVYAT